MDHYSTTHSQVCTVAAQVGVGVAVVHAMLEQGSTPDQIRDATPAERWGAWLTWEGIIGYEATIIRRLRECGYTVAVDPARARVPEPA